MPTGFQSVNDWGTIQIDETHVAVCVRNAPVITIYTFDTFYDLEGVNPLMFLGDTGGVGVVIKSRINIGTNRWRFVFIASAAVNVRIWHYDSGIPTYSTYGMQVFNPSGGLIYDSGANVLSMKAVYQLQGAGPQTFNTPGDGRTYAAALTYSRMSVDKRPVTHAPWDVWQEGLWVSSSQIYVDRVLSSSVGGEDAAVSRPNNSFAPPQILLIDVTGL